MTRDLLTLGDFAHHDWSTAPETTHPGETGMAFQQAFTAGPYRIRRVRYSADYRADHWCERGHIALVMAGEIGLELRDRCAISISAGQVFWVSDGKDAHRICSKTGAELYVIDEADS